MKWATIATWIGVAGLAALTAAWSLAGAHPAPVGTGDQAVTQADEVASGPAAPDGTWMHGGRPWCGSSTRAGWIRPVRSARLDELLKDMNDAKGNARIDAMAAVVNELARTGPDHAGMMMGMGQAHMMMHGMSPWAGSQAYCRPDVPDGTAPQREAP